MYFVYFTTPRRRDVVGGTMSIKSGKLLAERRAKHELEWEEREDGSVFAQDWHGKVVHVYEVEQRKG